MVRMVLYGPWAMENKFPMGHGAYGAFSNYDFSMAHGAYGAILNYEFSMTHGAYDAVRSMGHGV